MRVDPTSILIVLHGSIGDVTRALPLASLIRKGFPNAKLSWAVEAPSFPLVEHYRAIDEVILFDRRHWWRRIWPFLRKIRARRFDVVVDLQRHLKSGLISFLSCAPIRVGFNKADGKEFNWLFNNRFIEAVGDATPKISHYTKFAELLGIPTQPIEWNFELHPEEEKKSTFSWINEGTDTLCCLSEPAGRVSGGFRARWQIARVFFERAII
jgi:ADP-heptose:LPS heptosyltransferase